MTPVQRLENTSAGPCPPVMFLARPCSSVSVYAREMWDSKEESKA